MTGKTVLLILITFFVVLLQGVFAEEYYIIRASDGSEVAVKSYTFTDEYVQYTTLNDLPGFMKKDDFLSISNMIGVQPAETASAESIAEEKRKEIVIWIVTGIVLFLLYAVFMVYVTKRKNRKKVDVDIYYGRVEKDPVTQGHLSFEYKGLLGRKQQRTVEVSSAYEEEGTLYIRGYCTLRNEKKIFRADRIIGKVTDMSSDRRLPVEEFFVDAEE